MPILTTVERREGKGREGKGGEGGELRGFLVIFLLWDDKNSSSYAGSIM